MQTKLSNIQVAMVVVGVGIFGIVLATISTRFKPISDNQVKDHVGETRKVSLTVGKTEVVPGGETKLYSANTKTDFWVAIPGSRTSLFEDRPELFYKGKKVRAKGLVEQNKDGYYLRIDNPTQIEVLR